MNQSVSGKEYDEEMDLVADTLETLTAAVSGMHKHMETLTSQFIALQQRVLMLETSLRDELKSLRSFERSVHEALNSGDGSYKP